MGIGFDNVSGGELSGFFSCGSSNMLMGSRESNLVSLGVGWEEPLFHLCFPSSGARFLFYVLITLGCLL